MLVEREIDAKLLLECIASYLVLSTTSHRSRPKCGSRWKRRKVNSLIKAPAAKNRSSPMSGTISARDDHLLRPHFSPRLFVDFCCQSSWQCGHWSDIGNLKTLGILWVVFRQSNCVTPSFFGCPCREEVTVPLVEKVPKPAEFPQAGLWSRTPSSVSAQRRSFLSVIFAGDHFSAMPWSASTWQSPQSPTVRRVQFALGSRVVVARVGVSILCLQ